MRFIKLFKKQRKPKNNWYRVTSRYTNKALNSGIHQISFIQASSLEEAVEAFAMKRSQGEELVSIRLDNSVNFKK
jgi:hypothetical protein